MAENSQAHDDEIDLVELFEALADGKWKILGTIAIMMLGVFGYQLITTPNFKATTEIRPISSIEAESYRESNAVGFFQVSKSTLLDLYIEQIEDRKLFEEAIRKYKLLDSDNFEDEVSFNNSLTEFAYSIEILPPINIDGDKKGEIRQFWSINAEYNDEEKWRKVLSYVSLYANDNVKSSLQQQFKTSMSVAKLKRSFVLEDLELKINNILADYDRKTEDRLAFLREQASIARKLKVAKNTIEAQTFNSQNGMLANVKTDTPFYLRGYEAIEKEIELIESRDDKLAFIDGLLKLEQEKRGIEQDKMLERAQSSFDLTPIMRASGFSSVSVLPTIFETNNKKSLMFAVAFVLGGILGSMYVLISNAVRKRKEKHLEV